MVSLAGPERLTLVCGDVDGKSCQTKLTWTENGPASGLAALLCRLEGEAKPQLVKLEVKLTHKDGNHEKSYYRQMRVTDPQNPKSAPLKEVSDLVERRQLFKKYEFYVVGFVKGCEPKLKFETCIYETLKDDFQLMPKYEEDPMLTIPIPQDGAEYALAVTMEFKHDDLTSLPAPQNGFIIPLKIFKLKRYAIEVPGVAQNKRKKTKSGDVSTYFDVEATVTCVMGPDQSVSKTLPIKDIMWCSKGAGDARRSKGSSTGDTAQLAADATGASIGVEPEITCKVPWQLKADILNQQRFWLETQATWMNPTSVETMLGEQKLQLESLIVAYEGILGDELCRKVKENLKVTDEYEGYKKGFEAERKKALRALQAMQCILQDQQRCFIELQQRLVLVQECEAQVQRAQDPLEWLLGGDGLAITGGQEGTHPAPPALAYPTQEAAPIYQAYYNMSMEPDGHPPLNSLSGAGGAPPGPEPGLMAPMLAGGIGDTLPMQPSQNAANLSLNAPGPSTSHGASMEVSGFMGTGAGQVMEGGHQPSQFGEKRPRIS